VRRYRTEGEEIKLIDAYVEFVLCGKMPNLKIVYSSPSVWVILASVLKLMDDDPISAQRQ
jgi:hypothetical protein